MTAWRACILSVSVLTAAACRVTVPSDVGEPCDDSDECDGALGCVPTEAGNPASPSVCMPPPDGWDTERCGAFFIGDKDAICDCGCGAADVDCADDTAAACDAQQGIHCPQGQTVVPDDNTRCQ